MNDSYKNKKIKLFDNLEQQLESLGKRLEEELPDNVLDDLSTCSDLYIERRASEIRDPQEKVFEEIGKLFPENKKMSKEEKSNAMKRLFELIDPKYILTTLHSSLNAYDLHAGYRKFLEITLKEAPFPTLVKRYEVASEVFEVYQLGIFEPMNRMLEDAEKHASNIKKYLALIKQDIEKRKSTKSLRMGIGLASTIIAGPLGGIVSRGLFDNLAGADKEIAEAYAQIGESWSRLIDELDACNKLILVRQILIYNSLYGGLLLNLQKDLNALGYSLSYYNDTNLEEVRNPIGVEVKESEKTKLINWVLNGQAQVIEKLKEEDFKTANQISLSLVQFFSHNRPASEVVIKPDLLSYSASGNTEEYWLGEIAVYIRYAVVMQQIEVELWEKEKYQEAVAAYILLFDKLNHGVSHVEKIGDMLITPLYLVVLRMMAVHEMYGTSRLKLNSPVIQNETQVINDYIENFLNAVKQGEDCYGTIGSGEMNLVAAYIEFLSSKNVHIERKGLLSEWIPHVNYHDLYKYYKEYSLDKNSFYYYLKRKRFGSKWRDLTIKYKYLNLLKPKVLIPVALSLFVLGNGIGYAVNQTVWPSSLNALLAPQVEEAAAAIPVEEKLDNKEEEITVETVTESNSNLSLDEQLHQAIKTMDENDAIPIVKELLDSGANPNSEGDMGYTALMLAAYQDYAEVLRLMLNYSSNVDYRAEIIYTEGFAGSDRTALMIAAGEGNYEIAEALLYAGADPNFQDDIGATPLMHAAMISNTSLVQLLLDWGADVTIQSDLDETSLDYVYASPVYEGRDETIRIIEGKLDEIYKKDNEGASESSTDSNLVTDSYYQWDGQYIGISSGNKNGTKLSIYNQTDSQIDFNLSYWEVPWVNDSSGGSWGAILEQSVTGTAYINNDTALYSSSSCNITFLYSAEGIHVSRGDCTVGNGWFEDELFTLSLGY